MKWASEWGWNRQAERILSAVLRFGPNHRVPRVVEDWGYALGYIDLVQDGFQCRNPGKELMNSRERQGRVGEAPLSLVSPWSISQPTHMPP